MNKRSICFISFRAYPLFNKSFNEVFGGAEIDLYNLALELSKDPGNEVAFVVGDYGQEYIEYYGNIRVIRFRYFNLDRYKAIGYKVLRQLILWKELLFLKSRIIITEASSELLGWLAVVSKGIRCAKLIFRLASDLDTDFASVRKQGFKSYILYRIGIYNADIIISQTERQRELLRKSLGLDSIVIRNGFNIGPDMPIEKKKHILWVARSLELKRPDLFIELSKRLPSEKFVMIMPGTNGTRKRIEEKARCVPNLELIDYVPFADVQKYYNDAKLFVNTSEVEGFPNAFVQACIGRTPILSFKVDPDGFIGMNELGLCCNDDMDKAEKFINDLNDESLKHYGANAFNYVSENHSIAGIAHQYCSILTVLDMVT